MKLKLRSKSAEPAAPEGRMNLMEHLSELRSRLIKSVLAIVIGAALAWILYPQIFDFLLHPYHSQCLHSAKDPTSCSLFVTDPLEGFAVRVKVTGYVGIALAMPVILWQLWRFITPGLYSHERRLALPFVASTLLLFALGAGIAYWTMPKALQFLGNIGGKDLVQIYSPTKYFQLITYMMLAFGAGFEFPIILVFLQMAGILTSAQLRSWRRYAVVVIFVVVAVATPSGDPYSLFALSVPMCLFYEGSIVVGRIMGK
jgi:sec-independent protein translocase protein TatC